MDRFPETLKVLVKSFRAAVDAQWIIVIPDPFRANTLVFVILLGRRVQWSQPHEQALHQALRSATGLEWTAERKPLK